MTLNEVLTRQTLLSKLILKDGEKELSKELKFKIIKERINLAKVRTSFDNDRTEAIKQMKPDGFDDLANKKDKTKEENDKFNDEVNKLQNDYNDFTQRKLQEKSDVPVLNFTENELEQIVDVNSGNDIELQTEKGNIKMPAQDYMETICTIFANK